MPSHKYEYDVFISHAVSDRIEIVTPLVTKLEESGIKVWCSNRHLIPGNRLDETIKEGLNKSRHGILVITRNYLGREWPELEFHAMWGMEGTRILPVWHKVTKEEIEQFDRRLASYWALNTKNGSDLDEVVTGLVKAIREAENSSKPTNVKSRPKNYTKASAGSVVSLLLAAMAIWFFLIRDLPSNAKINTSINDRMNTLQAEIITDHQIEMKNKDGGVANIEEIKKYYDRYNKTKAQYRNEYFFGTGYAKFNFKKNVEPAVDKKLDLLTPENFYGFEQPDIYLINYKPSPHTLDVKYILINSQPADFEIVSENKIDDYTYLVEVVYKNHIRYLSVSLTYSKRSNWMKKRETVLLGFMPTETYTFKKQEDKWVFAGLED